MPQLSSLNVKIDDDDTETAMYCCIHSVYRIVSLILFSCFLGTTDLHTDTTTIETLTGLLIVRLEVLGFCEVDSVGVICDSVWQFVSALQCVE